ncbi:PREDICTED: rop guanine nucleotide exchange factor 12-like [Tarenaya hassleriana]|uniref:rop guanine nucleotide exchange factor 12-like n=1 Tax=Tarenaya hassleriana TaxID=28532 RepID=UPI00053C8A73|nr:PREDICTED: rop guanine nucleotide exchange factor 12-like [Tarenaya hassleriana]
MVRALEQEQESYRTRLFNFRWTNNNDNNSNNKTGKHGKSLSVETGLEEAAAAAASRNGGALSEHNENNNKAAPSRSSRTSPAADEAALAAALAREKQLLADMEQMKERFAKLLLGEDMSGGGTGVSSALALSNAFTNLAASVFGEHRRLEPMPAERKGRWRKEIDWLLSVTDYVVEFAPSQQKNKDGSSMEIMTTRARTDLHMNIPALKKLDAMLIDCLDNFKDHNEFSYVSKDAADSEKRKDDKWWIPKVKVPEEGLSDSSRRFLQYQKDCVNQVLKAAMAINAQVLSEMEIPESYIESLPKNGRASLGDQLYRNITVEFFDPDQFLSAMDMTSEHKMVDMKNRIEASIIIWKRKMNQKDSKSAPPWGSGVSLEKRELFEERAETILLILKQRFPGIPQSALDISKIQFNQDVGQAVLESYSRILESLAYTVLSRIEDVMEADRSATPEVEAENMTTTLSDFMGWDLDHSKKDSSDDPPMIKEKFHVTTTATAKKVSYLETLGGVRSPTARH